MSGVIALQNVSCLTFLKPSQEDITKPLLNESMVISSKSRATKNIFTGYIMFLSDSLQYRAVR